jgi:hypothetical protein
MYWLRQNIRSKGTYILTGRPTAPPLYSFETPFAISPQKSILGPTTAKAVRSEVTIATLDYFELVHNLVQKGLDRLVGSPNLICTVDASAGKT